MYCSALYHSDMYFPEILTDSTSKDWAIKYERYRFFLTFLTPLKMKCSEEILLFNSGFPVSHIIYDLAEFKQQLYVHDSDDKKLEFHSFSSLNCAGKYLIKIEFPSGKPFNEGEYRTVSLHYILEYSTFAGYFARIDIPLDLANNTYIFLEKPKEYQTDLRLFKRDEESVKFLIKERRHLDDELEIDESNIKLEIVGKNISKSKELIIIITHELHKEQKIWFNTGILFGWLSSVFILTELVVVSPKINLSKFLDYVPSIVSVAVAAITALIVIKGWIFTKDMDWILNDINNRNGIYFTYDRIYISLIIILVLEIGATIGICALSAIIT